MKNPGKTLFALLAIIVAAFVAYSNRADLFEKYLDETLDPQLLLAVCLAMIVFLIGLVIALLNRRR